MTQSLSTFSGHLKQIGVCLSFFIINVLLALNPNSLVPYLHLIFTSSAPEPLFYQAIRDQSTSRSLVLLDEVSTLSYALINVRLILVRACSLA